MSIFFNIIMEFPLDILILKKLVKITQKYLRKLFKFMYGIKQLCEI